MGRDKDHDAYQGEPLKEQQMPLTIRCPACRQVFQIRDDLAGKRVRCRCGQALAVPAAMAFGGPPPSDLLDLADESSTAALAAPRRVLPSMSLSQGRRSPPRQAGRRKKGSRGKPILLVAGLFAAVTVFACAGMGVVIKSALDRKLYSSKVAGPRIAISTGNAALPIWAPDAPNIAQLGATVSFDRFTMRLPDGYVLAGTTPKPLSTPPGGKSQSWTWASARTPRGTRHVISALLYDVGPTVDAKRFFEAHLPEYLDQIRRKATQVHRIEQGTVAGRLAVRVEHSQTSPDGRIANWIDLFWFDRQSMVNLSAIVPEADGLESFETIKAVLLTLDAR